MSLWAFAPRARARRSGPRRLVVAPGIANAVHTAIGPGLHSLYAFADKVPVLVESDGGRAEIVRVAAEQDLPPGSGAIQIGEAERRKIALSKYRLVVEILRDIEEAQSQTSEPVVREGKIGTREIEDYAVRVMLHFLASENLFPGADFDSFRIVNQLLEETEN